MIASSNRRDRPTANRDPVSWTILFDKVTRLIYNGVMMNDQTEYEVYREIWEIVSFRDGAVYKTRYIRNDWVPMGLYGDGKRLLYVTISDPDLQMNPRRKGVNND